jgi:hypothetical protein
MIFFPYDNFGAFLSQKSPSYPLHTILFICYDNLSILYDQSNNNTTTSVPPNLVCRVKAWVAGIAEIRNKGLHEAVAKHGPYLINGLNLGLSQHSKDLLVISLKNRLPSQCATTKL